MLKRTVFTQLKLLKSHIIDKIQCIMFSKISPRFEAFFEGDIFSIFKTTYL